MNKSNDKLSHAAWSSIQPGVMSIPQIVARQYVAGCDNLSF